MYYKDSPVCESVCESGDRLTVRYGSVWGTRGSTNVLAHVHDELAGVAGHATSDDLNADGVRVPRKRSRMVAGKGVFSES